LSRWQTVVPGTELPAAEVGALPAALRRRVLRGWLRAAGVPDLQAVHLDALDRLAAAELDGLLVEGGLPAAALAGLPDALRRRVLRGWLVAAGVRGLQAVHLHAVDALLTRWRGQGPVALPGGASVVRASGRLVLRPSDAREEPVPNPEEQLS
jgi:tRNA(Ile)-lysidine synthase